MKHIYRIMAAVGVLMLIPKGLNKRAFFKNKKNVLRPCDAGGCGYYGAPRKNHKHMGVDVLCKPGDVVVSPVNGYVTRSFYPYSDDNDYKGIEIQTVDNKIKIMYMLPFSNIVGTSVKVGQPLGIAQDISKKYISSIAPHLHVELWINGQTINPATYFDVV